MAKKHKLHKNSRYLATDILTRIEKSGAYSNLEIDQTIRKNDLSPEDAGLLTEMVYGVTQRRLTLDFFLEPYLKKAKRVENWVRQLLRLSVYQLVYLDRIPDHAVLNEAVNVAKARGHRGTGSFVNGVLRNFLRNERRSFEEITDEATCLSIEYSLPEWLVERMFQRLGKEETILLAASLLERSHSSARVNAPFISTERAIETLEQEGFSVERSQLSQVGVVSESGNFARSSLFKEGKLTIQDETSMLVTPAMRIEPHHQVLDACAAPGGKTTHIASFLSKEDGGHVTALDLHAHKIKLVNQNAKRLHVDEFVTTMELDARKASETFESEQFDRILVDAPCSGLGLMRRKPDIKYTKTPEDIKQLQIVQQQILESVAPLLKKGGLLVYSTCTITEEENQEVVQYFLNQHSDFQMEKVFVENEKVVDNETGTVTIFPHQFGTDGFFISALRKKSQ